MLSCQYFSHRFILNGSCPRRCRFSGRCRRLSSRSQIRSPSGRCLSPRKCTAVRCERPRLLRHHRLAVSDARKLPHRAFREQCRWVEWQAYRLLLPSGERVHLSIIPSLQQSWGVNGYGGRDLLNKYIFCPLCDTPPKMRSFVGMMERWNLFRMFFENLPEVSKARSLVVPNTKPSCCQQQAFMFGTRRLQNQRNM